MATVHDLIANHLCYFKNKSILEIACGCAEFSLAVANTAHDVACIDLDSKRLPASITAYENIRFTIQDATAMKFEDHIFDTVVAYNAIGHLDKVIPQLMAESIRVLKKPGHLLICSTWKLDKAVIEHTLLPWLRESGIAYELRNEAAMTIVVVSC